MPPLLSMDRASVFYDGTLTEIRLRHPEGVAVDRDGNVWCGGDEGEIYRISADGARLERMATTGGFTAGLAFDAEGLLYTCDLKHAAVFRFDPSTGELTRFAAEGRDGAIRIPNYPVVDARRGCLYVSDSHAFGEPGPGIWRFNLSDGRGELWDDRPLNFGNGMALAPDGQSLYVIETWAGRVRRIAIGSDDAPGASETYVEGIDRLPDGLAFDVAGNLYVSCYEPSRIYRVSPDPERKLELLIDDPEAPHPLPPDQHRLPRHRAVHVEPGAVARDAD